jgi:hypothetical protein
MAISHADFLSPALDSNSRYLEVSHIKQRRADGEVIEEYPDREPCPAVLILGFVSGRQFHAVVACCTDHLRIITVYWPDEERWINHCLRKNE